MNVKREAIYAALFKLLNGLPGFVSKSRHLKHWSDVPSGQQPALFQVQGNQLPQQTGRGLPPKWLLRAELYIYTWSDETDPVPVEVVNTLTDAIDAVLGPGPGSDMQQNVQTLGGLVSHCWIDDEVKIYDGVLGQQSVAIIPISILVP
jgi:hypothetical protein